MKYVSGGNLNSENLIFSKTECKKYKISFSDFSYFKFTQNGPSVLMMFSWNTKLWNFRKNENMRKRHKNVFPISENIYYREYAKRNTFLKTKICEKFKKAYFRFPKIFTIENIRKGILFWKRKYAKSLQKGIRWNDMWSNWNPKKSCLLETEDGSSKGF